jgi:hypothetical protein
MALRSWTVGPYGRSGVPLPERHIGDVESGSENQKVDPTPS